MSIKPIFLNKTHTAPEIFDPAGYGLAADIYSFAVLMWETFCPLQSTTTIATTAITSSSSTDNNSNTGSTSSVNIARNPLAGLEPDLAVQQVIKPNNYALYRYINPSDIVGLLEIFMIFTK